MCMHVQAQQATDKGVVDVPEGQRWLCPGSWEQTLLGGAAGRHGCLPQAAIHIAAPAVTSVDVNVATTC